jgi:hypothetical protein
MIRFNVMGDTRTCSCGGTMARVREDGENIPEACLRQDMFVCTSCGCEIPSDCIENREYNPELLDLLSLDALIRRIDEPLVG